MKSEPEQVFKLLISKTQTLKHEREKSNVIRRMEITGKKLGSSRS
jgi:hypothetical protein